jgi:hypothetical protein
VSKHEQTFSHSLAYAQDGCTSAESFPYKEKTL